VALPAVADDAREANVPAALNFEVQSIDHQPVNLSSYSGKVVVVVNVASECGATPQYKDLQGLYDRYKDQGLVVLGFPCNQFGGQEPAAEAEIKAFCSREYQVNFPLFAKVEVNGENAAAFYKHLTKQATKPKGSGKVGWNFEKFLISRRGEVVGRFATGIEPGDPQFVAAVEAELKKE
jgi:glutathione peroxidase